MKNTIKDVVIITAQAFDPKSGEPLGIARDEAIDEGNALFKDCKELLDYKKTYEKFWNELPVNPREVVFVQSIKWA